MEHLETTQPSLIAPNYGISQSAVIPQLSRPASITPQACGCNGASAGASEAAAPTAQEYIYALGRIVPRFPSLGIEKEFIQASGRGATAGQTDTQVLRAVLSDPKNRYLARQVCWVLSIEGIDTYLLYPRETTDLDLLLGSLRESDSPLDIDVVVGVRGPLAPPEACNGLIVPVVIVDQMYSFDREVLVKSIPKPEKVSAKEFGNTAVQLYDRIMQLADNAGATDEHRALNYLSVRYPAIYAQTSDAFARNLSLTGVEVAHSRLSGTRRIVDAIFTYTNRTTDVSEKYFVRVDVSEEFPFLVTKLSPYYDR